MASSTASLLIRLGLDGVNSVRGGLSRLGSSFRRLQGQGDKLADGLAKGVAGGFRTATIAAGAASAAFLIAAQRVDEVAKAAAQAGSTAEEFDLLRRVFSEGGVAIQASTETLVKFRAKLGEAAQGTGTALEAFKRLGLSARDLEALPLSERLAVVGEALSGVASESERARIATQLFEEQGVKLLPVLEQGSDAFLASIEAQREYGVISNRLAGDIERMNDSLSRALTVMRSFMLETMEPMVPIVADLTDALTDFANELRKTGNAAKVGTFIADSLVTMAEASVFAFGEMEKATVGVQVTLALLNRIVSGVVLGFRDLQTIEDKSAEAFRRKVEAYKANKDAIASLDEATRNFAGTQDSVNARTQEFFNRTEAIRLKLGETSQAADTAAESIRRYGRAVKDSQGGGPSPENEFGGDVFTIGLTPEGAMEQTDATLAVILAGYDAARAERDRYFEEQRNAAAQMAAEQRSQLQQEIGMVNTFAQAGVQTFSTFATAVGDALKSTAKEGTRAHKDAAQKAFAIEQIAAHAQVAVNGAVAISQAAASAPAPFNIPAIAAAVAQTAVAAAMVTAQSVSGLAGIADGGLAPGDLARAGFTGRQTMLIDSNRETVLPAGPSQDLMMIAETLASLRAGTQAAAAGPSRGGDASFALNVDGFAFAEVARRTSADEYERGYLTTELERGL